MKIKFDGNIADYAPVFFHALLCVEEGGTIELEKGIYPVCGKNAYRQFCALSNNDACEKAIAFPIVGKKNIQILGNGATLLLSDFISGFGLISSNNVVISDVNIDYVGNYHFELEVASVSGDVAEVKKRDGFDFTLQDETVLTACGRVGKALCVAFDPETEQPLYRGGFSFVDFCGEEPLERRYQQARLTEENGRFFLRSDWVKTLRAGLVLVICYVRKRYNQAMFITDCDGVQLQNVGISYSPSMAIMAQLSKDVTLQNVRVLPNGKHGVVSSVCDATHFTHCDGKVKIDGCRFFYMMDDAVNIHGNYSTVERLQNGLLTLRFMHAQQRGVCPFHAGDTVTLYCGRTADIRCVLAVEEIVAVEETEMVLRVFGDTEKVVFGDVAFNYGRMPEVEIVDTACGNNRPRGFLLNSPKKTVVRNCRFSNSEHGVELAGDTSFWFEAGCCRDVTVENCVFENCNHANGEYAVEIRPVFDDSGEEKYYHQNVTIKNNTFISFQNGMISARNTSGLSIYGNRFIRSGVYPKRTSKRGKIYLKDCQVTRTDGNLDLEETNSLLFPVWLGKEMQGQTAVFVGEHDVAPLLFPPKGNVTVTDFSGLITYEEGKDYRVTEGGVQRLNGEIPFYTEEEFYREIPDVINVGVNQAKIAFADGKQRYFKFGKIHEKTVRISYQTGEKTDIFGLNGKMGCCPKFQTKLREEKRGTILFYGDSITEGANASGQLRIAPFQETWTVLSHAFLCERYGADVQYVNTAVGGKDSVWGVENLEERVNAYAPDLLVLAFGMNDGGKSVEEFSSLTETMIGKFLAKNPNSEIMLVATSVPNTESTWYGNQEKFLSALKTLSVRYGTGLLDMTTLTKRLYGENGYIRYRDFTGNNVNHPNDFGVRLYAQAFLNELLGADYREYFAGREK